MHIVIVGLNNIGVWELNALLLKWKIYAVFFFFNSFTFRTEIPVNIFFNTIPKHELLIFLILKRYVDSEISEKKINIYIDYRR